MEVTKAIANWADEQNGVFLKYADDLYMVMMSRKGMSTICSQEVWSIGCSQGD